MVRKLAKEKYSGTLRLSIKNFMGCGKKMIIAKPYLESLNPSSVRKPESDIIQYTRKIANNV